MLQPILHQLNKQKIILASSSPRRSSILKMINLNFEVIPSSFEEITDPNTPVCTQVMNLAAGKCLDVFEKVKMQNIDLIIGADTIVSMDNKLFLKPLTPENACKMLRTLSGKHHQVYSGVCLLFPTKNCPKVEFFEKTEVKLMPLHDKVIDAYVATQEPLDKAGGYGIQALGGSLIEGIIGDYFNVQGFPLNRFCRELVKVYSPELLVE